MFTPVIAEELRRRGHDVIAVAAEPELRSLTDAELYASAKREKRRIVTENVKDFRRLLVQDEGTGRPGLLFTSSRSFPRSRRSPGALIVALDAWLSDARTRTPPLEVWLRQAASANAI
ncbi:MAG: DUF5615 family PIN-like protein [Candidatus Dormibacteraeota bacterium]|nr:DUF5615 family PIN-like protein [Candidatus Dormibacteraeota bacterium]